MELRHLKYFIAVAEELNFHRAAERLNISQPPLSQQIKQLEEEIGTELFYRTNRVVTLSEAGKVFLEKARQILDDAYIARREARFAAAGQTGQLQVNFVASVAAGYLQKSVSKYRDQYPEVYLKLKQSTSHLMPDEVEKGETDIGLVRLPIKIPDTLDLKVIKKEALYVAMPVSHKLSKHKTLSVFDIAEEPLITTPRSASPYYYEAVMSVFRRENIAPNVRQEAIEQFTIAGLVASGLGIALVPEVMRHIKFPGVIHIPLKNTKGLIGLGAITRKEPNVLVSNFLELFDKEIS